MEAKQVPLIELLERVPQDARLVVEHDQFSSSSHPVGRLCHEAATALRAALEQEQGEPVAWMRNDGMKAMVDDERDAWVQSGNSDLVEDYTVPLYTAPPQRKPLTDEEIEAIADTVPIDEMIGPTTWHIRLCRVIERKHGIGGEE